MDNNELYHYGRKGMKWGQRIFQNKDGTLTNIGKKRYERELTKLKAEKRTLRNQQRTKNKIAKLETLRQEIDTQKSSNVSEKRSNPKRKKSIKEMSDAELRGKIDRLRMEKEYKSLLSETRQTTLTKGKKFAENVFTKSGENLATQVVNHYGAKWLNKKIGDVVIFANNKKNK